MLKEVGLMKMEIIVEEMNKDEIEYVDQQLEEYNCHYPGYLNNQDQTHFNYSIKENDQIIGGIIAGFSCFKIVYISILWVDENHRNKGYGKILLDKAIESSKKNGANLIRVDTFSFQGESFYLNNGFTKVGEYQNDNYKEYFFIKKI